MSASSRSLWMELRSVAHFDAALFHRRPKLALACLGSTLVPALYAIIYLSSSWDPYAHLEALSVAVVNLDQGAVAQGTPVSVGATLLASLEARHPFTFTHPGDEATARRLVSSGDASFALIVPPDFSRAALSGASEARGRLKVLFSEGNNFMVGSIARRFAQELTAGTNEALNGQRWAAVLDTVERSQEQLETLRHGVKKLEAGAAHLDEGLERAHLGAKAVAQGAARAAGGAGQLKDGTTRLAGGVSALGRGLLTMRERLPSDATLFALAEGAEEVADGDSKLARGLVQLADGTERARDGAQQLKDGTKDIPLVGEEVAEGAGRLEEGLAALAKGAGDAREGSQSLAAGAARVADGTERLTRGVGQLAGGIRQMADRVPDDAALGTLSGGAVALHGGLQALSAGADSLEGGLGALSEGAKALHDGLVELAAGLPTSVDRPPGDAPGLAAPVEPELEAVTTVGALGNSMAPYFLALSLWVGVVTMGFIFQLRWFPRRVERVRRLALVLGRLGLPLGLVIGQATVVTLAFKFVLQAEVPSFPRVWLIAVVSAVTFVTLLLMLVALLGDIGKGAALLLLVFQMGASGGIFPRELTGPVFRVLSPWLPFTWAVRAGRAGMFGAYDGQWAPALGVVGLFAVASLVVTIGLGRWRFVPRHRFGPLLDL